MIKEGLSMTVPLYLLKFKKYKSNVGATGLTYIN